MTLESRNGFLYVNDSVLIVPRPTYRDGFLDLLERLSSFHPETVRYFEAGRLYSSATIIVTNDENTEQLPVGAFIPRPRYGIVVDRGFRDPFTKEIYTDHVLEALTHRWFSGLTIREYPYTPGQIRSTLEKLPQVALAVATVNPREDGTRLIKIRGVGSERQMAELMSELERIPLAVKSDDTMPPVLGKEGLGNSELYQSSV